MGNPLANVRSFEDARPALAALKEFAARRASDAVAASRPVQEAVAERLAFETPKAKRLLDDVKRRLPERRGESDMSDRYEVVPDDLHTHAAHIETFRERFTAIQSAIDSVQQDDEAYGIICQFLPPILEDRQQDQGRLSLKAQSNFEKLARALHETADSYTAADEAGASEYRRIGSEL